MAGSALQRAATPPVHAASDSERSEHADTGTVPKVLNLTEAAALLRCSRAHLCNIVNGKIRGIPSLPSLRIGRRVLFRRESLEQWLRQIEATNPASTPNP
jgi:excisionase family DNA binding protein